MSCLQKQRRRMVRARGMTLVEIMVVLAIITLVMGAVGINSFQYLKQARQDTTRQVMNNVENALIAWQSATGETCPSSLSELKKYLKKEPKDGWNNEFTFKCPGEHDNAIDLISKGDDGKEGTADDIKSWEDAKKKKQ